MPISVMGALDVQNQKSDFPPKERRERRERKVSKL